MNSSLMKIRCKYLFKDILKYVHKKRLLQIVRYNKYLKKILRFDLKTYMNEYSKIVIDIEVNPPVSEWYKYDFINYKDS